MNENFSNGKNILPQSAQRAQRKAFEMGEDKNIDLVFLCILCG
jgi:hypothetical protein